MTQTKYSFKSLVVAYVIASAFFSSCKIQGQTTSSKDEIYLVDYVNPLIGTDSKKSMSNGNKYPAIATPQKAETVTPYHYKTYLAEYDEVIEVTPTERAAQFKFTFPESDAS